jgi:hypothetical protein
MVVSSFSAAKAVCMDAADKIRKNTARKPIFFPHDFQFII